MSAPHPQLINNQDGTYTFGDEDFPLRSISISFAAHLAAEFKERLIKNDQIVDQDVGRWLAAMYNEYGIDGPSKLLVQGPRSPTAIELLDPSKFKGIKDWDVQWGQEVGENKFWRGRSLHIGGSTDLLWIKAQCEGKTYFLLSRVARFGVPDDATLCPIPGTSKEVDGKYVAVPGWEAVQKVLKDYGIETVERSCEQSVNSCAASLFETLTIGHFDLGEFSATDFEELKEKLWNVPAADSRTHEFVSGEDIIADIEGGFGDATLVIPFQQSAGHVLSQWFKAARQNFDRGHTAPELPEDWAHEAFNLESPTVA